MTRGYAYDDSSGYMTLALRVHQEEEGYEYASHHNGSESGSNEARVELATLYQPLHESTGEAEAKAGAVVRLCHNEVRELPKAEPCA